MSLPSRELVVEWFMALYDHTFNLVFVVSIITVLYVLWNLVPRKEY